MSRTLEEESQLVRVPTDIIFVVLNLSKLDSHFRGWKYGEPLQALCRRPQG